MPGPKPLPLERIWDGLSQTDTFGCWLWLWATSRGYGVITSRGRQLYVHRVAWELTNGPIPEGMVVMHGCDQPLCARPDHLFLGTQADNIRDAARKARTSSGESRPNHKVTAEQVAEMRRLASEGWTSDRLASRYPISARTIRKIVAGKNWRHGST